MEIGRKHGLNPFESAFKIDLIVWKSDIDDEYYVDRILSFKIDLIVWKYSSKSVILLMEKGLKQT